MDYTNNTNLIKFVLKFVLMTYKKKIKIFEIKDYFWEAKYIVGKLLKAALIHIFFGF
jgi:hypothetical protein